MFHAVPNELRLYPCVFLHFIRFLENFRNCLAAMSDPPEDTRIRTQFSGSFYEPPGGWGRPARRRILRYPVSFIWLVYHWCDEYVLDLFCTPMNGMMNYDLRLFIWWQLCESLLDWEIKVHVGIGDEGYDSLQDMSLDFLMMIISILE